MKKIILLKLFILLGFYGNSQIQLIPIKPMSDDVQMIDAWHLSLILNGKSDFTDYMIEMNVYKQNTGKVYSARTLFFKLSNDNSILHLNRYNISIYIDYSTVLYPDAGFYSQMLANYGYLLHGVYLVQFILYGKSESPGSPGGMELLKESEMEFEIGNKYPPHLIYPYDEDTIDTKYPTLTWTPPYPIRPGQVLTFDLKMVEIDSGQTATSALLTNASFYCMNSLYGNYLPYPINAPTLEEDQPYAWQIKANINGQPAGETEIWAFVYNIEKLQNKKNYEKTVSYVELKINANKVPVLFVESIRFFCNVKSPDQILRLELFEDGSTDTNSVGSLLINTKIGDNFFSYTPGVSDSSNAVFEPLFEDIKQNRIYVLKSYFSKSDIRFLRFEFKMK